jgi:tetratricopeptide (TPR) repeat protein
MNNANWQRVKDVYGDAAELPPAERGAFLDSACGHDADFRRQVDSLLVAHDEVGTFLGEPDDDPSGGASRFLKIAGERRMGGAGEGPGTRIDRYTLHEAIGEGGFGSVYRAEQTDPVRRQVALKIIKLGMDTRQVIARFEAERQALALMDHPGIARVFDGGATEAGRPYFVMELVDGAAITEFCRRHGVGRRAKIELLVDVCRAVQHAHQKGVIHRDIKPSNVLVTTAEGAPRVKVIDFGVAKAIHGPLTGATLTQQAQYIGTPAYMSPEQADASSKDVDTRADVYSLGVLLYEMLVTAPPFESQRLRDAGLVEALRIVREEPPPRPSSHDASLRGDLDWIILKAIEKDRARRYDAVSALADDLERYLRDEPVAAGPPSASYRFRKFARRNRGALVAGAAVAALLAVATVVSTVGFLQAREQRDRAQRAEARALQEKQLAEDARGQAEIARDDAESARDDAETARDESGAVTQFLVDMLTSPDPSMAGRDVTVREILDDASAHLEEEFGDRPEVLARLHVTIGRSYSTLGVPKEAEQHLPVGYRMYRELYGESDARTVRAMSLTAFLRKQQGRYPEALELWQAELDHFRATAGADDPETLGALNRVAEVYQQLGRYEESIAMHREIAEQLIATVGEDDDRTLRTLNDLGVVLDRIGRYDEAEQVYKRVLDARMEKHGERDPDTITTLHCLAALYEITDRIEEAEALFVRALELSRAVQGPEHPETLMLMNNLSSVWSKQKRFEEEERLLLDVLEIQGRVLSDEHPEAMVVRNNLAHLYQMMGRHEQAVPLLLRVIESYEKIYDADNLYIQMAKGNLGNVYNSLERWDEAEKLLVPTVETCKSRYPEHGFTAAALRHYGNTLIGQERFEEAEPILLEAYERMGKAMGPDHVLTHTVAGTVARLYELWGRPEQEAEWRARSERAGVD